MDAHGGHTKLDVRHPAHFDHQGAQVWRVEWNVTGTTLASSGDDGCIRLWKGSVTGSCIRNLVHFFMGTVIFDFTLSLCTHVPANYLENWKCISVLNADGGTTMPPPPLIATHTPHPSTPGHFPAGPGGASAKEKPANWYAILYSQS